MVMPLRRDDWPAILEESHRILLCSSNIVSRIFRRYTLAHERFLLFGNQMKMYRHDLGIVKKLYSESMVRLLPA